MGAPKQAVIAPNGEWELPNLGSRSPQTRSRNEGGPICGNVQSGPRVGQATNHPLVEFVRPPGLGTKKHSGFSNLMSKTIVFRHGEI